MRRVSVVGNTGAGKSTLGRALARRLSVPYVELDAINHQPGWTEISIPAFRDRVTELLATDGWVVDGNYRGRVGDIVRAGADTVVWLDYPRPLVIVRVVRRTVRRVVTRQELWNGNREPWTNLFTRDPKRSIIAWSWQNHAPNRAQYEAESADPANAHLTYVRLRSPAATRRWLVTCVDRYE